MLIETRRNFTEKKVDDRLFSVFPFRASIYSICSLRYFGKGIMGILTCILQFGQMQVEEERGRDKTPDYPIGDTCWNVLPFCFTVLCLIAIESLLVIAILFCCRIFKSLDNTYLKLIKLLHM